MIADESASLPARKIDQTQADDPFIGDNKTASKQRGLVHVPNKALDAIIPWASSSAIIHHDTRSPKSEAGENSTEEIKTPRSKVTEVYALPSPPESIQASYTLALQRRSESQPPPSPQETPTKASKTTHDVQLDLPELEASGSTSISTDGTTIEEGPSFSEENILLPFSSVNPQAQMSEFGYEGITPSKPFDFGMPSNITVEGRPSEVCNELNFVTENKTASHEKGEEAKEGNAEKLPQTTEIVETPVKGPTSQTTIKLDYHWIHHLPLTPETTPELPRAPVKAANFHITDQLLMTPEVTPKSLLECAYTAVSEVLQSPEPPKWDCVPMPGPKKSLENAASDELVHISFLKEGETGNESVISFGHALVVFPERRYITHLSKAPQVNTRPLRETILNDQNELKNVDINISLFSTAASFSNGDAGEQMNWKKQNLAHTSSKQRGCRLMEGAQRYLQDGSGVVSDALRRWSGLSVDLMGLEAK